MDTNREIDTTITNTSDVSGNQEKHSLPVLQMADNAAMVGENQVSKPQVQAQMLQWAQTAVNAKAGHDVHQPFGSPPSENFSLHSESVLPQMGKFNSLSSSQLNYNFHKFNEKPQPLIGQSFFSSQPITKSTSANNSSSYSTNFQKPNFNFASTPPPTLQISTSSKELQVNNQDKSIGAAHYETTVTPINSINTTNIAPKSLPKTFAQVASPTAVSGSIPNKGTTPECGLLVERMKGTSLDDYAKAIEAVSGKNSSFYWSESI